MAKLQVLPPGATSMTARLTPAFSVRAPAFPVTTSPDEILKVVAPIVLGQDPRQVIHASDWEPLRRWTGGVINNTWRSDITPDELIRRSNLALKASCLYLQGAYWGTLPPDWTGDSLPDPPSRVPVNMGYGWPNDRSPAEQRIFYWNVDWKPIMLPGNLRQFADDVQGRIFLPIIRPGFTLQKLDASDLDPAKWKWRVLNFGDTDRRFLLLRPSQDPLLTRASGMIEMTGWSFLDWATATGWIKVFEVVGAVVAVAIGVVTGGVALVGGAGLYVGVGAAVAAFKSASAILDAGKIFLLACASGDALAAIRSWGALVQQATGINPLDFKTFEPGLQKVFGSYEEQIMKAFVEPLKALGEQGATEMAKIVSSVVEKLEDFYKQIDQLLVQFSIDTVRAVAGSTPELFFRGLASMGEAEINQQIHIVQEDLSKRLNFAVNTYERQVPLYLRDWFDRARKAPPEIAARQTESIPWFARTAWDLGIVVGELDKRLTLASIPDLNALTPRQKRALFFGDISAVCGTSTDPNCLLNSTEFMRQADLFWESSVRQRARFFNLLPLSDQAVLDLQTSQPTFSRR